jgi:hypothetical protein
LPQSGWVFSWLQESPTLGAEILDEVFSEVLSQGSWLRDRSEKGTGVLVFGKSLVVAAYWSLQFSGANPGYKFLGDNVAGSLFQRLGCDGLIVQGFGL